MLKKLMANVKDIKAKTTEIFNFLISAEDKKTAVVFENTIVFDDTSLTESLFENLFNEKNENAEGKVESKNNDENKSIKSLNNKEKDSDRLEDMLALIGLYSEVSNAFEYALLRLVNIDPHENKANKACWWNIVGEDLVIFYPLKLDLFKKNLEEKYQVTCTTELVNISDGTYRATIKLSDFIKNVMPALGKFVKKEMNEQVDSLIDQSKEEIESEENDSTIFSTNPAINLRERICELMPTTHDSGEFERTISEFELIMLELAKISPDNFPTNLLARWNTSKDGLNLDISYTLPKETIEVFVKYFEETYAISCAVKECDSLLFGSTYTISFPITIFIEKVLPDLEKILEQKNIEKLADKKDKSTALTSNLDNFISRIINTGKVSGANMPVKYIVDLDNIEIQNLYNTLSLRQQRKLFNIVKTNPKLFTFISGGNEIFLSPPSTIKISSCSNLTFIKTGSNDRKTNNDENKKMIVSKI